MVVLDRGHYVSERRVRRLAEVLQREFSNVQTEVSVVTLDGRELSDVAPKHSTDTMWPDRRRSSTEPTFGSVGYANVASRVRHDFLLVVRRADMKIERVVQGPEEESVSWRTLHVALKNKLAELDEKFPRSEYEVLIGQGSLDDVKNSLPNVTGWEYVHPQGLSIQ